MIGLTANLDLRPIEPRIPYCEFALHNFQLFTPECFGLVFMNKTVNPGPLYACLSALIVFYIIVNVLEGKQKETFLLYHD